MRPGWVLPGLSVVVLIVGLAGMAAVWGGSTSNQRSYDAFLGQVAAGDVRHVVQTGTRLDVQASDGDYVVQVPSVMTSVFDDMQAAAAGSSLPGDVFEAQAPADPIWFTLAPIVVANLLVAVGIVALAVVLLRRGPTAT
ncbi:MAG TPA: hypothetical protein VD763_01900 [Candidatus Saccharimonadales bacterium]|nr:hypothetical protein [Candidatus Saccharimonadales bacterium]